ncbi:MAG: hypothetical protein DRG78_05745 [Epsilonproteobacteria bacterium]|nr:MAG: hypothetical protein DRG78_05745 [Campylobacterota bacterium]
MNYKDLEQLIIEQECDITSNAFNSKVNTLSKDTLLDYILNCTIDSATTYRKDRTNSRSLFIDAFIKSNNSLNNVFKQENCSHKYNKNTDITSLFKDNHNRPNLDKKVKITYYTRTHHSSKYQKELKNAESKTKKIEIAKDNISMIFQAVVDLYIELSSTSPILKNILNKLKNEFELFEYKTVKSIHLYGELYSVNIMDSDDLKIAFFLGQNLAKYFEDNNEIEKKRSIQLHMISVMSFIVKASTGSSLDIDMFSKLQQSIIRDDTESSYGKYGIYSIFKGCYNITSFYDNEIKKSLL